MEVMYKLPSGCTVYWTVEAVNCYKKGCNCSLCDIPIDYETIDRNNCSMKYVVRELVRKFGAPISRQDIII